MTRGRNHLPSFATYVALRHRLRYREGMQRTPEDWPAQWLRGPLPLCVLSIIAAEQPVHGYGITRTLEAAGLGTIGGGTLYPLLGRLERDGLVRTDWVPGDGGPARKTYAITEIGVDRLSLDVAAWSRFAEATATLLASREESRS